MVLIPRRNVDKPVVVLELKYNKSAEGAIKQIKEKQYVEALHDYVGEVVLVGVNYNKRIKTHECKIERIKMTRESPSSHQVVTKYSPSNSIIGGIGRTSVS